MICKAKALKGYTLSCLDGEIGGVKEFYFDDKFWTIRYLVADTGGWLNDRQVLISPHALVAISNEDEHISTSLTKQQIINSPSLSSDMPVSQQFEADYYGYYGWPVYWGGSSMWGGYPFLVPRIGAEHQPTMREERWDRHLRSTKATSGYHIQALDHEIGHVEDFLIDDENWSIRYLVVDTRNWWPGKKILIAPQWIEQVSWDVSKIFVNLSQESIKDAPEYTEDTILNREYETALHRHYESQSRDKFPSVDQDLSRPQTDPSETTLVY